MNHNAIRKAYPQVVTIDDSLGAFDANGNLIELDESKIEQAYTEIQTEEVAKKNEIKIKRAAAEAKLAALGLTTDDLKALGLN